VCGILVSLFQIVLMQGREFGEMFLKGKTKYDFVVMGQNF
jgi:hypothetical protein